MHRFTLHSPSIHPHPPPSTPIHPHPPPILKLTSRTITCNAVHHNSADMMNCFSGVKCLTSLHLNQYPHRSLFHTFRLPHASTCVLLFLRYQDVPVMLFLRRFYVVSTLSLGIMQQCKVCHCQLWLPLGQRSRIEGVQ